MTPTQIDQQVAQAREAIGSRDERAGAAALLALAPVAAQVPPVQAVDLLERACVFGTPRVVRAAYDAFGEFAYEGWALALALRCANEPVARLLLGRGVDLLGEARPPADCRTELPHEGVFTRFDLTRRSHTIFLTLTEPTVASEVFEPFREGVKEHLAGEAYGAETSLAVTCDLVARLAGEGRFDAVVFDDLLRAALVRASDALSDGGEDAEQTAETCLAFGARMLDQYFMHGQGDETLRLILGNLIVPKVHPRIVTFVCAEAPDVFLERLHALHWLRRDAELVRTAVSHLRPSTPERNGTLLEVLAGAGCVSELRLIAGWQDTFTSENVAAAVQAAATAGHGEAAAWLLGRHPRHRERPTGATGSTDDLAALLL